ncbi:MAG: PepSY-like domain-containing protein [Bacteroidota bacterium]
MKNLVLIFVAASFISLAACAQGGKDLPAKVKTAFDQKFPGAQKIKWGKENATEWEAEFKMNEKNYSANYTVDGKWMESEYEISVNEIPVAVATTLGKEFPGYKLLVSEVSETVKGKVYEFDIKIGNKKKEVALNPDGTLVKKEAVKK